MIRQSLLLGVALAALAGASHAQQRKPASREDLLDALTRHIQICAELSDSQARLGCYDKLQTQIGDVQSPAPTPTPLASNQPPLAGGAPPAFTGNPQPGGAPLGATPLAPPPLTMPGGGPATLGGGQQLAPPPAADPDRAFDPRSATSAYRPPEGMGPKPQPTVRRTGARPLPTFTQPMPIVTLQAANLTYGQARYWQVSITVTSNVARNLDTQVQCTFLNAGRPVGDAYFGPVTLAPGEQVSTELIGPPTTAYVDSTNCKVLNP